MMIAILAMFLNGCDDHQKAEANNKAQEVKTEIKKVTDNVKYSVAEGTVTFKVMRAMNSSDKLNTADITVDTNGKVMALKGTVPDVNQKALAERIANDTVGNDIKVVNQLGVKAAVK